MWWSNKCLIRSIAGLFALGVELVVVLCLPLVWLLLRLIIKSLLVISLNLLLLIWPVGTKEAAQESSSSGRLTLYILNPDLLSFRFDTTPPFSLDFIIRYFIGVLLPHHIDLVILVLSGMSLISHMCSWPWP